MRILKLLESIGLCHQDSDDTNVRSFVTILQGLEALFLLKPILSLLFRLGISIVLSSNFSCKAAFPPVLWLKSKDFLGLLLVYACCVFWVLGFSGSYI